MLRAAAAAGVPALELRAVSNAVRDRPRRLAHRGGARGARRRRPDACSRLSMRDLPPPLPPAERTVGQLVGETIRAYGNALLAPAAARDPARGRRPVCVHEPALDAGRRSSGSRRRSSSRRTSTPARVVHRVALDGTAFSLGLVDLRALPARSARSTSFPAIAWFAFIGLAVPAALVERLGFRAALVRGRELGRADYVHALGSLATLVLVVGIAEITLQRAPPLPERTRARERRSSSPTSCSRPLLYIGGALLYDDQAARVGSPRTPTEARRPRCRPTSSSRR